MADPRPLKILADRLSLSSNLSPAKTASSPGAVADAVADATGQLGPTPGSPLDLYSTRPGMALRVDGNVESNASMTDWHQASAFKISQPLMVPKAISTDPTLMGHAGVSLSYTAPDQGDGSHDWVRTQSINISGSAGVNTAGIVSAVTGLTPYWSQAGNIASRAGPLFTQITNQISDIQNSINSLTQGGAASTATILSGMKPLLDKLHLAQATLSNIQGLLQDSRRLVSDLQARALEFTADSTVSGSIAVKFAARRRLAEIRHAGGSARLTFGIEGSVITPIGNPYPEASSALVPGLQQFHTAMVMVQSIFVVTGDHLSQLSKLIDDATKIVDNAANLADGVSNNPYGVAAKGAAKQLQAQAQQLQGQTATLELQAKNVLSQLGANINTGLRTTEVTGPGVGLSKVGVQIDGQEGNRFDYKLAMTFRNLLGQLPGSISDYRLVNDTLGGLRLQRFAISSDNVYHAFEPATAAIDAATAVKVSRLVRLEARAGVQIGLGNAVNVGYAGLISHLANFYLGPGVILPSLSAPETLPPLATFSAGYNGPVTVGVSGSIDTLLLAKQLGIGQDVANWNSKEATFMVQLGFKF